MTQYYGMAFPFFTAEEIKALTDDIDLRDLFLSAPFKLGGEDFHFAHEIEHMLDDLMRTAPTAHVLHAAGEYVLADEDGDVCTIQMTEAQHEVVSRAAEALHRSELNVVARILREAGFALLCDNWQQVNTEDAHLPASSEKHSRFARYAPPFPFVWANPRSTRNASKNGAA